jgi:GntR family transcriptional regulator, transcriptional repressor for pyruvate dehydrogenase complex
MSSPIKPQRTVDVVCSYLREKIIQGIYPPKSCLPPERKLAKTLQINRLTLRAAMSRLQAEHLLESHHGKGVVVLDYLQNATLDIATEIKDDQLLEELFVLRKSLLVEVVCLACQRISSDLLQQLYEHIEAQSKEKSIQKFFEGDLYFVQILIDGSQSIPLQLIFNSFHRVFRAHEERTYEILQDKSRVLTNYQLIFSLIRNRDDDLSRRALFGHFTPQEQERVRELYITDWT